uniref:Uncharacterized protein n=1 Tax=Mus spicilegus TaxID=10103 RepID=A0A8C6I3T4_MUSSI
MTHVGAGGLTTDSCCIVSLGVVDGFEVQLILGSFLVGLLVWGFTFDAWSISTLEEGREEEMLLQVTVTLGSLADFKEHFFRIWKSRLFKILEMLSQVNSGVANGGSGH